MIRKFWIVLTTVLAVFFCVWLMFGIEVALTVLAASVVTYAFIVLLSNFITR